MNLSWDLGRKVVPVVHKTSAPSGTDTAYNVPTLWLDDTANVAYLLVDITSGTATWRQLQTKNGAPSGGGDFLVMQVFS